MKMRTISRHLFTVFNSRDYCWISFISFHFYLKHFSFILVPLHRELFDWIQDDSAKTGAVQSGR
ncbi:hypothetical protein CPB84DRAFT_1765588 [Gymnopilus junonius]|uniref:Uncharacterized protein n=1 Tax=Gymnopilus junonius TaxID=109634 RepID=A0A9P5TQ23_GYMJU|nr:hypothetical protein CPB84DRAFT_1770587 [Gymnopilus junonius]KAF8909816.1 hypothetical protein CPB84DRAFT_1765588 [Gymnopilus junonius]